jgi:hypothetical protein
MPNRTPDAPTLPLDPETVKRATRPVCGDVFRKGSESFTLLAIRRTGDIWIWHEHDKAVYTFTVRERVYPSRARLALEQGWTFTPAQEIRKP